MKDTKLISQPLQHSLLQMQYVEGAVSVLQTSSADESTTRSGAPPSATAHPPLSSSASQLHGQLPRAGSTNQHSPAAPVDLLARLWHGLVSWWLHPRGKALCPRLGMTTGAWEGCCKLHVNPFVAMGYFCGSSGLTSAAYYFTTGIRGGDFINYFVDVTPVSYVVAVLPLNCAIWRWGP